MTLRTVSSLAALLLLAGGAGACGSSRSPGSTPPSSPTHSTTQRQVTPPHDFAMARQVSVLRSGGLLGRRTTTVFALDRQPPDGYTERDVRAVLRAGADPRLAHLTPTTPGSSCCDRYVYRVSVEWPDGTTRTFTTVDGDPEPAPLARLVRLAT